MTDQNEEIRSLQQSNDNKEEQINDLKKDILDLKSGEEKLFDRMKLMMESKIAESEEACKQRHLESTQELNERIITLTTIIEENKKTITEHIDNNQIKDGENESKFEEIEKQNEDNLSKIENIFNLLEDNNLKDKLLELDEKMKRISEELAGKQKEFDEYEEKMKRWEIQFNGFEEQNSDNIFNVNQNFERLELRINKNENNMNKMENEFEEKIQNMEYSNKDQEYNRIKELFEAVNEEFKQHKDFIEKNGENIEIIINENERLNERVTALEQKLGEIDVLIVSFIQQFKDLEERRTKIVRDVGISHSEVTEIKNIEERVSGDNMLLSEVRDYLKLQKEESERKSLKKRTQQQRSPIITDTEFMSASQDPIAFEKAGAEVMKPKEIQQEEISISDRQHHQRLRKTIPTSQLQADKAGRPQTPPKQTKAKDTQYLNPNPLNMLEMFKFYNSPRYLRKSTDQILQEKSFDKAISHQTHPEDNISARMFRNSEKFILPSQSDPLPKDEEYPPSQITHSHSQRHDFKPSKMYEEGKEEDDMNTFKKYSDIVDYKKMDFDEYTKAIQEEVSEENVLSPENQKYVKSKMKGHRDLREYGEYEEEEEEDEENAQINLARDLKQLAEEDVDLDEGGMFSKKRDVLQGRNVQEQINLQYQGRGNTFQKDSEANEQSDRKKEQPQEKKIMVIEEGFEHSERPSHQNISSQNLNYERGSVDNKQVKSYESTLTGINKLVEMTQEKPSISPIKSSSVNLNDEYLLGEFDSEHKKMGDTYNYSNTGSFNIPQQRDSPTGHEPVEFEISPTTEQKMLALKPRPKERDQIQRNLEDDLYGYEGESDDEEEKKKVISYSN